MKPTKQKKKELHREYENLQKYLQDEESFEVYSANKQQADRSYATIKENKDYPIVVRKDLIDIEECESQIAAGGCRDMAQNLIAMKHHSNLTSSSSCEMRSGQEPL